MRIDIDENPRRELALTITTTEADGHSHVLLGQICKTPELVCVGSGETRDNNGVVRHRSVTFGPPSFYIDLNEQQVAERQNRDVIAERAIAFVKAHAELEAFSRDSKGSQEVAIKVAIMQDRVIDLHIALEAAVFGRSDVPGRRMKHDGFFYHCKTCGLEFRYATRGKEHIDTHAGHVLEQLQ